MVTAAESERKRGEGGKCEYGRSGGKEDQRAGEEAGKTCPIPRGLTWNIRRVGGTGVAGSRLSAVTVDQRIWRGRLKVGEPSGVGCLRNQRGKHFLWQLLKNLNECAFK